MGWKGCDNSLSFSFFLFVVVSVFVFFPHIVTVTIKMGGGGVVWWSRRPLGEAQLPNRTRPQCFHFLLVCGQHYSQHDP